MRQTLLDDMKNAHPVILIDGQYLIVGHQFSTLAEAFHTANALIVAELETLEKEHARPR